METGSSEVREGREEAGESEAIDETKDGVNENSRGQGAVPWRLGVEHPKAKLLLLRIAVVGDHKVVGASKQSNYYRKYGNPNKMAAATWRKTSQKQELPTSDDGTQKTWREKQTVEDLRYVSHIALLVLCVVVSPVQ